MPNDQDYSDGRYSRPFSGGDWNVYRQGQADKARWDASRAQTTSRPTPGPSAPAATGGDGSLIALGALLIGLVLTPVAAILAAVATPILVGRMRRRGRDPRRRDVLWPAAVTAFVIVAVNGALGFVWWDTLNRSPISTILWIELVAVLAGGLALRRMDTHDTYLEATVDAALAFLAPVGAGVALLALGYRFGAPDPGPPLIVWLPALGAASLLIGGQTGLAFAAVARFGFKRPFAEAAAAGVSGAFLSIAVTGLLFYFYPLGESLIDQAQGVSVAAGGLLEGLAGFVLLQLPGVALCAGALGWGRLTWPSALARCVSGAALAVVSNVWALNALSSIGADW